MSWVNTPVGPRILLAKPLTSHITSLYLSGLPSKVMWRAAYKRLFKLRYLVDSKQQYAVVLRRRFEHGNFNLRREIILPSDSEDIAPLTQLQAAVRLANTYAFVFNATCNATDEMNEVTDYDLFKEASQQRIETSILNTILRMDKQAPNVVKYDRKYDWVARTRQFYDEFHLRDPKKRISKGDQDLAALMGYLQYEHSIMMLNEKLQLML